MVMEAADLRPVHLAPWERRRMDLLAGYMVRSHTAVERTVEVLVHIHTVARKVAAPVHIRKVAARIAVPVHKAAGIRNRAQEVAVEHMAVAARSVVPRNQRSVVREVRPAEEWEQRQRPDCDSALSQAANQADFRPLLLQRTTGSSSFVLRFYR